MEQTNSLEKIALPFNKEVEFINVVYDNNFSMLRLRIREGKRFTMIDLDPATAEQWQCVLSDWLKNATTG